MELRLLRAAPELQTATQMSTIDKSMLVSEWGAVRRQNTLLERLNLTIPRGCGDVFGLFFFRGQVLSTAYMKTIESIFGVL